MEAQENNLPSFRISGGKHPPTYLGAVKSYSDANLDDKEAIPIPEEDATKTESPYLGPCSKRRASQIKKDYSVVREHSLPDLTAAEERVWRSVVSERADKLNKTIGDVNISRSSETVGRHAPPEKQASLRWRKAKRMITNIRTVKKLARSSEIIYPDSVFSRRYKQEQ
eukprot:Nk52_evm70s2118 gene=Nk52_evmTU70s2118